MEWKIFKTVQLEKTSTRLSKTSFLILHSTEELHRIRIPSKTRETDHLQSTLLIQVILTSSISTPQTDQTFFSQMTSLETEDKEQFFLILKRTSQILISESNQHIRLQLMLLKLTTRSISFIAHLHQTSKKILSQPRENSNQLLNNLKSNIAKWALYLQPKLDSKALATHRSRRKKTIKELKLLKTEAQHWMMWRIGYLQCKETKRSLKRSWKPTKLRLDNTSTDNDNA